MVADLIVIYILVYALCNIVSHRSHNSRMSWYFYISMITEFFVWERATQNKIIHYYYDKLYKLITPKSN